MDKNLAVASTFANFESSVNVEILGVTDKDIEVASTFAGLSSSAGMEIDPANSSRIRISPISGTAGMSAVLQTSLFDLIAVSHVRTRLGSTDGNDQAIKFLIEGYSSLLVACLNREVHTAQRTEYFSSVDTVLILSVVPVISIDEMGWQKMSGGMTLNLDDIDDDYYYVNPKEGFVHLNDRLHRRYDRQLVVKYTAGFPMGKNNILDFSQEPQLGAALRQACVDQVAVAFQRRQQLGISSVSRDDITENLEIDRELPSYQMLMKNFTRYI